MLLCSIFRSRCQQYDSQTVDSSLSETVILLKILFCLLKDGGWGWRFPIGWMSLDTYTHWCSRTLGYANQVTSKTTPPPASTCPGGQSHPGSFTSSQCLPTDLTPRKLFSRWSSSAQCYGQDNQEGWLISWPGAVGGGRWQDFLSILYFWFHKSCLEKSGSSVQLCRRDGAGVSGWWWRNQCWFDLRRWFSHKTHYEIYMFYFLISPYDWNTSFSIRY